MLLRNRGGIHTLRVAFEDGSQQIIDLRPVLAGEMYGPLLDKQLFDRLAIDSEAGTLVWPNGVDFDPATLHDWPTQGPELVKLAQRWAAVRA